MTSLLVVFWTLTIIQALRLLTEWRDNRRYWRRDEEDEAEFSRLSQIMPPPLPFLKPSPDWIFKDCKFGDRHKPIIKRKSRKSPTKKVK